MTRSFILKNAWNWTWMDLKMLEAKQRPFKHHFRAWGNAGDSRKVRLTSTTKKPHKPQAKTLQDPELPHSKACQNPAPDSQSLLSKNGWRSVPCVLGHKTENIVEAQSPIKQKYGSFVFEQSVENSYGRDSYYLATWDIFHAFLINSNILSQQVPSPAGHASNTSSSITLSQKLKF